MRLGKSGTWDDETASPGFVLENPAYAADPAGEKKYLMIYSGSCKGVTMRSLGIARTDDLRAAGAFDDPQGRFWEKDPEPLLPPSEDIENSSLYFDEKKGMYWLFTNHVKDNRYTDAVWVYWSRDLNHWNVQDKAVAMDASMSRFGKGAIGMPSVVKMDESTLALFYDASPDGRTDHLDRSICMVSIPLPLRARED